MIAIGHIASTYGLLPSEVVARATTYDLMIADVYTTWQNYQQNPDKLGTAKSEDLEQILERARNGT